jgi:hypothetical protein
MRDLVGQELAEMGDVVPFAGAVDDHVHFAFLEASEHQIVEDAAILGHQQRIDRMGKLRCLEVGRHQRLERGLDALAGEGELTHVADVEQSGVLARPQMLGHDAFILDGHLIAGERDHPTAPRAVPAVERKLQDFRRFFARIGIMAISRAARLGEFVGRAVMDVSAHHGHSARV